MRLQNWFRRSAAEQDLHEELQFHIERQIEANVAKGMNPEEARYAAIRQFGNVSVVKESARDLWRGSLEMLIQDFRHTLRMIRRAPGFTIVAVLTLAIAIGGTTTMFSVVNGVLLKPLGYGDPADLVTISASSPSLAAFPVLPISPYYIAQWRAHANTIESVAGVSGGVVLNLSGTNETPERLLAIRVSANLFPMLGVQPEIGRNFLPPEDQQVADSRVVILSSGLWTRRFGRDPNVVGTSVQLNGIAYRIIGVMSPEFHFPKNDELHRMVKMPDYVDLWAPLVFQPEETQRYISANYASIARLKHGTPLSAAESELTGIIHASLPKGFDSIFQIAPLRTNMVDRVQQGLVVLLLAMGVVLLISCVNITNLLLGRAANHRPEVSIRSALGASRAQLARIPLAESLVVAACGAGTGALLAAWLLEVVRANAPFGLPRVDEVGMDMRSFLFTAGVTLISATVCGAAPAWRFSRINPGDALHEAGRTATSSRSTRRLKSGLLSFESALCVILTVLAGLLIHSFIRITKLDQGFRTENVSTANVIPYGPRYAEPAVRASFFQNVLHGLEALPGNPVAGAVSALPLTGQSNIMNVAPEASPDFFRDGVQAEYRIATRGYFIAMGIPVVRGELFADRPDGPKTAIVSEETARRLWPGQDPVGKRFMRRNRDEVFTVAGVVGNVRTAGPDREPPILVYVSFAQQPQNEMTVVFRGSYNGAAAIRQVVASVDKTVPVGRIRRIDEFLSSVFATRRFQMLLLTAFAGVALLLAAIGIYGVVSSSVTERRREIGVRLALGASRRDVAALVLKQGLTPVAIGMACGIVCALFAARAIQSLLFGIAPIDIPSLLGGILVLLISALLACWIPASTATRVDPINCIRYE